MAERNILNLVSVSIFGGVLGRLARYLVEAAISTSIGPAALGAFAVGSVVLQIGVAIANLGFENAAQKFIPIYYEDGAQAKLNGLTTVLLVVPVVLGLVIGAIFYLNTSLLESYTRGSFPTVLRIFALGIPMLAVMTVANAATRGFKETKYAVVSRDIVHSGIALVGILIIAFYRPTPGGAAGVYVLSLAAGAVVAVGSVYHLGGYRLGFGWNLEFRTVFRFALLSSLSNIALLLISWTDIAVLTRFALPASVGQYRAGYQTSVLLLFLLQASNSLLPSVLSDLDARGDDIRLKRVYQATTKWIFHVTVAGYAFLLVFGNRWLQTVFGITDPSATIVLLVLGGAQLFTAATGSVGYLLLMQGLERLELANTIGAGLTNLLLNLLFIPRYGIVGAGAATAITLVLLNSTRVVEAYLLLDIQPFTKSHLRGFGVALLVIPILLAGWALPGPQLIVMLATGAVTLVTVLGVHALLGFEEQDRALLETIE